MTKPYIIAYARCSTEKQDLEIQIEALRAAGADRIFTEKLSGARIDRPELRAAIDFIQPGNVFMVYRLDRLARSVHQTVNLLHEIEARGAEFKSITEGFDTSSVGGRALFQMVAVFAEMERTMIVERVREGVKAAREKGVKFGRKPVDVVKLAKVAEYLARGLKVEEAARAAGLGRSTVYKHMDLIKIDGRDCGHTLETEKLAGLLNGGDDCAGLSQ